MCRCKKTTPDLKRERENVWKAIKTKAEGRSRREEGWKSICIQTFAFGSRQKGFGEFLLLMKHPYPQNRHTHTHIHLSLKCTSTTYLSLQSIPMLDLLYRCNLPFVCFFIIFSMLAGKRNNVHCLLTREFQGKVGEKQILASCNSLWQVSEKSLIGFSEIYLGESRVREGKREREIWWD